MNLFNFTDSGVDYYNHFYFLSEPEKYMGSKYVHCPKTHFLAIRHFLTSKYSTSIFELFLHKDVYTTCTIFNFLNTFQNLEFISNVTGIN